jgi:hypothetical protein
MTSNPLAVRASFKDTRLPLMSFILTSAFGISAPSGKPAGTLVKAVASSAMIQNKKPFFIQLVLVLRQPK